jgi:hypothetical protein
MSAFMCSETHIGALVRFWVEHDRYGSYVGVNIREVDWRLIFRELARENVRSLRARYPSDPPTCVRPTRTLSEYPTLEPVSAIKQAQCYEYQACEHDGWATSEAQKITRQIIGTAITALPGFEAAPWGL